MSIERPTAERLAKASEEFEERVVKIGDEPEATVVQMLDGSVLDRLLSRRQIATAQYSAGVRFYGDWYAAGLASSGVIDPSKDVVDGGNSEPAQVRQAEAAGRWVRAVQAVGKIHSNVLINVLLIEMSLQAYGQRDRRYADPKDARLAATVSLRNALTELDHHYYGQREDRPRHSHAPDYRPAIVPVQNTP